MQRCEHIVLAVLSMLLCTYNNKELGIVCLRVERYQTFNSHLTNNFNMLK